MKKIDFILVLAIFISLSSEIKIFARNMDMKATSSSALSQGGVSEQEMTNWLFYLDNELEKLIKNPYQIISEDEKTFQIVYLPSLIDDVIEQNVNSQINLPIGNKYNVGENIYYIPSSSYRIANKENKGFSIGKENIKVLISPNMLDMDNDLAVIRMEDDILKNKYEDYFVKITCRWHSEEEIENKKAISKIVEIKVDIISADQKIDEWGKNLQKELIDKKDQFILSAETYKKLENIISDNVSARDISFEIDKIIEKAENDVIQTANRNMSLLDKDGFSIDKFYSPIFITVSVPNDGLIVGGYELYQGKWEKKEVITIGEAQGINVLYSGIYGFSGNEINFYENTQKIKKPAYLIAKYHLDQIFGSENINLNSLVTRKQCTDTISRLSNMEIKASEGGLNEPIEADEAVYWVMMLYETKTDSEIDNLKLDNENANMKIDNLESKYEISVKAAIELGLIDHENFVSNDNVKIGQFLSMLEKLDVLVEI